MSLLRRSHRQVETRSVSESEALFQLRRQMGVGGVSDEQAMTFMAVWRCQHLLADIVAGLPIDQFRDTGTRREEMTKSEFVRRPSEFVRPKEWRYQLMLSALASGNAYPIVTQIDARGKPSKAEIVAPGDVAVDRPNGALQPPSYKLRGQQIPASKVLHFRAFGPAPGSVLGMSPLHYARNAIGLGVSTREQVSKWHDKGGHPTALLRNKNPITPVVAETAKLRYRRAVDGDDLVVLGGDWELTGTQIAPSDQLFLVTSNVSAVDVCGFFGVPPEMLGLASAGSSVTYANREQRALDLLVYTVQWWVDRVEQLISEQLPEPQYVKLNVGALLRSDVLTRYRVHDMAVRMGSRSPDEVRRLEDESPIPNGAGDEFLWPPYSTTPQPAQEVPA